MPPNKNYLPNNDQHIQHEGVFPYLLGMGEVSPPGNQDLAVAHSNHMLDNLGPTFKLDPNIDPELQMLPVPQILPASANAPVNLAGPRIVVRIPVGDKVTRDIEFKADIAPRDFLDRVCAVMNLDSSNARLGWKPNDDPKRGPARQLATDEDVTNAFGSLIKLMNKTRRQKEVFMQVFDLDPPISIIAKKKTDGNKTTDFGYSDELRHVKEKLRCATHPGDNRWCYVNPSNPNDHAQLGVEIITLWARCLKDDPDLDRECLVPPSCLSFDKLCQCVTGPRGIGGKAESQPIHVHINNHPLAGNGVASPDVPDYDSYKRKYSTLSSSSDDNDSESESESLTVSEILDDLHQRLPKLNLPQYKQVLEARGIEYAECVSDFGRKYYIELGMAEGAVGPFLKGVDRALRHEKRDKKKAKVDKENQGMNRFESVEI